MLVALVVIESQLATWRKLFLIFQVVCPTFATRRVVFHRAVKYYMAINQNGSHVPTACEGCHCFLSYEGYVPYVYFGSSAICAWGVWLFQCAVMAHHVISNRWTKKSILASMVLLFLSVLCRAIWLSMRACGYDDIPMQYVNRFSSLTYFSGFTLYLQTWYLFLASSKKMNKVAESDPVAHAGVCLSNGILNAIVWICVFGLSVAYWTKHDGQKSVSCPYCDELGYIFVSMGCMLVSIGFLYFGARMYCTLRKVSSNKQIRQIAKKVVIVASICFVCFSLRSIFWLWKPVAGEYSPKGTYPFMHYTVTELIPSIVLFIVLAQIGIRGDAKPLNSAGPKITSEFSDSDLTMSGGDGTVRRPSFELAFNESN